MEVLNIPNGSGGWIGIPLLQGKSAYQSAIDGGYIGDETSFNLAIATTNEVYIGSVEPTHLEEIWIDPSQGGTNVLQTTGTSTSELMSQNAISILLNQKVSSGTTVNGYPLSSNVTITASDLSSYTSGQTDSLLNNKLDVSKQWELGDSIIVLSLSGATVSPDFTNAIYKADVNYAGGVSVSWIDGVNYNFPLTDSCTLVYLKNTNDTDRIFTLQTATYTYNSIVYTFLDLTGGILTVPTGKILLISYLFIYDSATTCRVEIITKIQS